jgi:Sulfotransferase domain
MTKPNFFIIGAPKCGTTSLHAYLASHPQIFMSVRKEPTYFDSDLAHFVATRSEGEYLRYFSRANDAYLAVGEASSDYLYSRVAVPRILDFNPNARFVVMVRNPIDMASSLHAECVKTLVEDVLDFSEAWGLEDQRRAGYSLPRACYPGAFIPYGDVCRVGEQVERLYKTVSRERVHVIVFEDLCEDPRRVYTKLLAFLGVPDDGRTQFSVHNPYVTQRSRVVRNLTAGLLRLRYHVPIRFGIGVIEQLILVNVRADKRPPLPLDLREQLAEYFRSDVDKLSALLGRDLTGWTSIEQSASTEVIKSPARHQAGV